MSRMVVVVAALSALVGTPVAAAPPVPPDVTVEVRTISYAPSDITVPHGTLVRWENVSSPDRVHDVVSSIPGAFTSGHFHLGDVFTHRFTAGGTFTYICSIHDLMIGAVHVPMTGRILDGPTGPLFRIRLSADPLPADSPFRFVVVRRDPGTETFVRWLSTRAAVVDFQPTAPGTYEFAMRLKNVSSGKVTGPGGNSPVLSLVAPG
jgi:plastocyanin